MKEEERKENKRKHMMTFSGWLAKLGGFSSESALESNLLEYSKMAACSEIWHKEKKDS